MDFVKGERQIEHKFNVRVKKYKDGQMEIVRYYSDSLKYKEEGYYEIINKLDDGTEGYKQENLLLDNIDSTDHIIRSDSIYRAKSKLMDYAIQNRSLWKSFITLTFADNITDLDKANRMFRNWVTIIKRKDPDFKYLGVPEFQKRGAVHYHILTSLLCGSDLVPDRPPLLTWNPKHNRYYKCINYDISYWQLGFSTAFDIIRNTDSDFKLEYYITKYLFCDKNGNRNIDNRLFGRQKLLHSKGLELPTIDYFNLTDDEFEKLLDVYKDRNYEKKELISNDRYVPSRTLYTIK